MINTESFMATVADFLLYLHEKKKISHHTKRAYKTDLLQFLSFWEEQNLSTGKNSFENALNDYLKKIHRAAIEKRSMARKFSSFASFIKYLESKGHKLNAEIKRPTFEKKLPHTITPVELFELLDIHNEALPSRFPFRDKTIIEILYATGITSSELVRLTIGDININNQTITIIGKKNDKRTVFFGTIAKKRLLDYVNKERISATNSIEPLFLNHQNQPLTTRSIQKICAMFKTFLKNDIEFTPHTLRHSFATHLIENGADKKDLKELLGFKAILSTEQYAHIIPKSSIENEF